ncbi:hypothetical protein TG1_50 [Streptomyces phage TG1]|uniref:Uncharacterized protein n=2 Tax=Tigunavirus TG1 TaxID=374422 RepID=K4I362_9CAUD|nr:hypothetical protein D281_gp51 [Streptomyces phage TG1]AFU62245.1 hypothetical protein TG1_50 [Streptomyces phage TG1]
MPPGEAAGTPDAVLEALTDAVLAAYADHTRTTRAHLMLNVVAPLRERLIRYGVPTVEAGGVWANQEGPVSVTARAD